MIEKKSVLLKLAHLKFLYRKIFQQSLNVVSQKYMKDHTKQNEKKKKRQVVNGFKYQGVQATTV